MTYMTKAQLRQHLLNAPAGTTPGGIVAALRAQGVQMEGDPTPAPQPSPTAGDVAMNTIGNPWGMTGQSLPGKAVTALTGLQNYVASPIKAASGLIQQGVNRAFGLDGSKNQDIQELPQNAEMARTSLPLTVGLATAPLSLPASALATGVAATVGRGMVESSDAITGKDQQSLGGRAVDALTEGAVAGVTDLAIGKALNFAGKTVKSLYSPLAGRFDSELAALASKKGINLPASSVSDSGVVRAAEAATQKSLFGGSIEEMVDTASKKLVQISDDLVRGLGGSSDLTVAGKSVIEGANTYRETWRALKNKAYQLADEALAKGDVGAFSPNTSKTQKVIGDILSRKSSASGLLGDAVTSDATTGILQTLMKNLQSGQTIPLRSYTSALDELNQLTKFGNTLISTGDQAVLKKIIATLDEDVTSGIASIAPKAAKALRKADDIYIKGIKLLDSTFGDKIAKLSDNPTKIVDQLITPNSVDDVPGIFELIGKGKDGPQRINDVRSAFTKKLLQSSSNNETGEIIGRSLANRIAQYGDSTIKAVLGEDGFQALREIQMLGSAIDQGQAVAKGSQTAFLAKVQGFVVAVATGNIPLAASIAGGDMVMSKLFTKPWFKQWITQGFSVPEGMQAAGNIASQAARRGSVMGSQAIMSPSDR